MMRTPRAYWSRWADTLGRWGMKDLAAWLLEAGGPLTFLGAQALYFVQPFSRPLMRPDHLEALAGLLEDNEEAHAFALFLQEGIVS